MRDNIRDKPDEICMALGKVPRDLGVIERTTNYKKNSNILRRKPYLYIKYHYNPYVHRGG